MGEVVECGDLVDYYEGFFGWGVVVIVEYQYVEYQDLEVFVEGWVEVV